MLRVLVVPPSGGSPDHRRSTIRSCPRFASNRWGPSTLQDAELRAAIDTQGAPTRDHHVAYWTRRHGSDAEESFAVLADEVHVGNCGLIFATDRTVAELWLYLGKAAFRGEGVGKRAAELLLERAFAELGLKRARVRVLFANPRARRFWQEVGFREEESAESRCVWLCLEAPSVGVAR
jgi:RimJ/RimL family protein N-acetyltransferase